MGDARLIEIKELYKVQNADKIARKEDYAHLKPDQLLVRTFFATLQGEGPFAGWPCVFLRLGGCNLGDKESFCQWCDTDFRLSESAAMSFAEVEEAIEGEFHRNIHNVDVDKLLVITGGEPGLQPNTADFIFYMGRRGWRVQVETNGTQRSLPEKLRMISGRVVLVVSPKAGPKGYGAMDVGLWAGNMAQNVLKLVVDSDPRAPHHFDERAQVLAHAWQRQCGPASVYLSPMAIYLKEYKGEVSSAWEEGLIDRERTRKNYNYAYQECLKHGLLLSTQQHLFAEAP